MGTGLVKLRTGCIGDKRRVVPECMSKQVQFMIAIYQSNCIIPFLFHFCFGSPGLGPRLLGIESKILYLQLYV